MLASTQANASTACNAVALPVRCGCRRVTVVALFIEVWLRSGSGVVDTKGVRHSLEKNKRPVR